MNVEPRSYASPRISPDGTRLAVEVVESGNRDIWIYDLIRKTFRRLTFDPASDARPVWTPDGQRVAFSSARDQGGLNLFWQRVDGAAQAQRLTTQPNSNRSPWAFTPDGQMLLFTEANPDTQIDLLLLSMERGNPKPLLRERFLEGTPALSPDGRWIAYRSDETGRLEIYVRPFPGVDKEKWPITTNGGSVPVWAASGRELFYQNGDSMMVVPIETEATFKYMKPQALFSWSFRNLNVRNFDISPDGQRFLMIKDVAPALDASDRDEITIVLNWTEEVKRLVPPPK